MRTLERVVMGAVILANVGCGMSFDFKLDISVEKGNGTGSSLPRPENGGDQPTTWEPDQQERVVESEAFIANDIYGGRTIEKTVQGPSGKIYDYLRMPPLDISAPDITGLLPPGPTDGIQLGMTEVESYPELWGPAGTTVFTRPDFSKYIMNPDGATSIQDWLDNHVIPGIPNDPNRLYAGLDIVQPNVGVYARINAFKPEVEKGTLSVIELAVGCPAKGAAEEFIGVLIGADWKNYAFPPTLDLSVERWRYVNGKREGGFNKMNSGFKKVFNRIYERFAVCLVGA